MKKNKVIKLISFVIITLIVFQLIPITSNCDNGFQSHTQSSKALLSSVSIHADALLIGRESQKLSIKNVRFKNALAYFHQILIEDIAVINFSFQEMPFDYRRIIRQSIPHYFYGSKYKNHFVI